MAATEVLGGFLMLLGSLMIFTCFMAGTGGSDDLPTLGCALFVVLPLGAGLCWLGFKLTGW